MMVKNPRLSPRWWRTPTSEGLNYG